MYYIGYYITFYKLLHYIILVTILHYIGYCITLYWLLYYLYCSYYLLINIPIILKHFIIYNNKIVVSTLIYMYARCYVFGLDEIDEETKDSTKKRNKEVVTINTITIVLMWR